MCIVCIYADGALKPLEPAGLVEGQCYIVFLEELDGNESPAEREELYQRLQALSDEGPKWRDQGLQM
jgi:predicted DNA-binding antitoxin AbrB/MazE fold protein